MKKLDTSPIAPGIAFKPKGGTLLFLQLAYQEAFNALMQSNIGSSYDVTKGYILYGCVNIGSGTTYTISAGAIFFNGEIYLCDGGTFTISGSNVAEGVITTTQYTADADPSVFTDGVSRNVHNIRKIIFQSALAGSGAFDYTNGVFLQYRPQGGIGQIVEWDMPDPTSLGQNAVLSTYFNTSTLAGVHPLTLGWNIIPGGKFTVAYLAADPTFGSLGATGGANSHMLAVNEVPALTVTFPLYENGTANNTNLPNYPAVTDNNTIKIGDYTGTGQVNNGVTQVEFPTLPAYIVKLKIKRVS